MPARMPSSLANLLAVIAALSPVTLIISSTRSSWSTSGMNPAPIPWILWGPGFPPLRTGDSAGSTAITLKVGFLFLMMLATPVMVPPVPTPATIASTFPSVSFHISSAVVLRWISGFSGFRNC